MNGAAFMTELIFPNGNNDDMEFYGNDVIVELFEL